MRIWRIEHWSPEPDCTYHHGPVWSSCPAFNFTAYPPSYGIRLETPEGDPKLGGIRPDERVGTLPEQFPRWWPRRWVNTSPDEEDDYYGYWEETSYADEPRELPEGWWAVLYEVPEEDARIGTNQVVFKPDRAERILRTQTDFPRERHPYYY